MIKFRVKPSAALLWLSGAFVVLSLIWCQLDAQRALQSQTGLSQQVKPKAKKKSMSVIAYRGQWNEIPVTFSSAAMGTFDDLPAMFYPAGGQIPRGALALGNYAGEEAEGVSPPFPNPGVGVSNAENYFWTGFEPGWNAAHNYTGPHPSGSSPDHIWVWVPECAAVDAAGYVVRINCIDSPNGEHPEDPGFGMPWNTYYFTGEFEVAPSDDTPVCSTVSYPYWCVTSDAFHGCVQAADETALGLAGYEVNTGPHDSLETCEDNCAQGPTACFSYKTACLDAVFADCSTAGDAVITDWDWDFDGTPFSGQTPSQQTFTAGNHEITLTVTDANGLTDTATSIAIFKDPGPNGCDWGGGGGGGGGGTPGGGTGYCAPLDTPNPVAAFAGFHSYNSSLLRFPVQFCGGAQGYEQHSGAPEFRTRVDEMPGSESRLSYDVNGRRVVEISSMVFDEAAKDEWEAFLGLTDNGAKSFLYFDTARHILNAEVIGVSDGVETQYQLTYTRSYLGIPKTIDVFYPDHGYPPTYHPQGSMMAPTPSHMTQFLTLLLDGVVSEVGWVVSRGTEAAPGGLLEIAGPVAPGTVLTIDGSFYLRMIIESPACPMLRAIGLGLYELSTPLRLVETEEIGGL